MRKLISPGIILPWDESGNLGGCYQGWVDLLAPLYEWVVFQDHDVEMMHRDWHECLRKAISIHPDAGCFTCRVNRQHPGNEGQSMHVYQDMNDAERLQVARSVREKGKESLSYAPTDERHLMSGCWFAVNVDAVQAIGGFCSGFQGVDWDLHERLDAAGFPVYVIEGIYCHHRYRHPEEAA